MRRRKRSGPYNLDKLLSTYSARPALFFNEQIKIRREEFETAYAMNRLEGAAEISEAEIVIADLWITGRITQEEYFQLCDFDVERKVQSAPLQPKV